MSTRHDSGRAGARARPERRGVAALEALVSITIFLLLVGSVAYAARIALSVMTESMHETRLLYRVRRALDRVEEQLSRVSKLSVVTLTEEGYTLAGLENYFEQLAAQNPGTPVGDAAEGVRDGLKSAGEALEKSSPDYGTAVDRLDSAVLNYNGMVVSSMISVADALKLTPALDQILLDAQLSSLVSLGGTGVGRPGAWAPIETMLNSGDPLIATEPLISAEQMFFRQVVLGPGGPEYFPPVTGPPCAYYVRPMRDGTNDVELVYFDGSQYFVLVNHLTDVEFTRTNDMVTITLTMAEESHGQVIQRTETRTVVLRAP